MPGKRSRILELDGDGLLFCQVKSGGPGLGQVVRAFKSKCAVAYMKYIKTNELNVCGKIWQRSFYDHIIRNEESLNKIRTYIRNNPLTWAEDENNPRQ